MQCVNLALGAINPLGSGAEPFVNSNKILNTKRKRVFLRLSNKPAPSYYAATAQTADADDRPMLQGDHQVDVAVVGGGIAGCSAALHLAKRGFKVALLEARFVGYGASGRSGGQTIFGLAASQRALSAQVGREDARRLFDLSIEALDCTQALINTYRLRLPTQSCARRHQAAPPP